MQRTNIVDLGTINLKTMTTDQNKLICQYVTKHQKPCVYPASPQLHQFTPKDGSITYIFSFQQELIKGRRESDPNDFYYYVKAKESLGEGANGKVFDIEIPFAAENGRLINKSKSDYSYVVKVEERKINSQEHFERIKIQAKNESTLTNMLSDSHAKAPVIIANTRFGYSYTIMRRIKGSTLDKVKFQHADHLIEMSIQAFLALDEQIDAREHIHRDIKPENTIVAKNLKRTTFIDFGLSISTEKVKIASGACGTVLYMAPEVAERKPIDIKADVFSAMVMVAEKWGIENLRDKAAKAYRDRKAFLKDLPALPVLDFSNLQTNILLIQLNQNHYYDVLAMFKKGIDIDPQRRPTPGEVIEFLEKIRLERIFATQSISEELQLPIIKANHAARKARHEVAKLKMQLNLAGKYLFGPLNKVIEGAISQVQDNNDMAFKEFVTRLGIKVFQNSSNKNEALSKLENIKDQSLEQIELLLNRSEAIKKITQLDIPDEDKQKADALYKKVNNFLLKYTKKSTNIDEMSAFILRMEKEIPIIDTAIKQLALPHAEPLIEVLCKAFKDYGDLNEMESIYRNISDIVLFESDNGIVVSTDNVNNCLIKMYAEIISRAIPEKYIQVVGDFIADAKDNILSLKDPADLHAVFEVIKEAKKVTECKIALWEILLPETDRLYETNKKIMPIDEVSANKKSALSKQTERLDTLSHQVDKAKSIQELLNISESACPAAETFSFFSKPPSHSLGLFNNPTENFRSELSKFQKEWSSQGLLSEKRSVIS